MRLPLTFACIGLFCALACACTLDFERKAKQPGSDAGGLDASALDAAVPEPAFDAAVKSDGGEPGDGAANDAGTRPPSVAIAQQGTACATAQARACTEHNGTQTLLCKEGTWQPYLSCKVDERCDTRLSSPTSGSCAPVLAACADVTPGAQVCDGALRVECGVDRVTATELPCPQQAACEDESVSCQCLPGFRDQGGACTDINECAAPVSPCHPDATCTNLPGSFVCQCEDGFHGDGKAACERNEVCIDGGGNCDAQATCENLGGVAYCVCKQGYQGDGESCVDVDECAQRLDDCDRNPSACVNQEGDFACVCPWGYAGNGKGDSGCSNVDDCADNPCQHGGLCTDLVGDYSCTCSPYATGKSCENPVAQCGDPVAACGEGYICNEQPFSPPNCVDLDECAQNLDNCDVSPNACINAPGGFSCACPDGFSGSGVGDTCVDANECNGVNVCTAAYPCVNLPDGTFYRCEGQFPDWSLVAPPTRFSASTGVVTDALTGLRWQQQLLTTATSCADSVCTLAASTCGTDARCTAAEAKAFCDGLVLGGAGDWRLPTRAELVSIAVVTRSDPALDLSAFPGATPETVWTKSPLADQNGQVWIVNFSEGSTAPIDPMFEGRARCVR